MKALWFVVLISLSTLAAADNTADYTELCRLFKDNTIISMPGTCDKYIECLSNGESQVYTCASTTAFDIKSQSCVAASDSCSMNNRCEGKSGVWVADPTNCHGFFYCQNGDSFSGHCENDLHFNEAEQMCIHTTSSSCVDVSSLCELVADKTKFRDETDCSYYYECASKKQTRKACSKTYFDVQSQSCVDKSQMTCDAHPYPSNVCGTASKPKKNVFVGDGATCRGFFYCANLGSVQDLEPVWGQCPEGKFFDEDSQSCLNPVDVKCSYNRCESRGNLMVSSSKNNCHDYLICENGFVKEERTCPRDYFFDELYQACVPDIIYYNCCDIK